MLYTALALFSLAVILGLTLISFVLQGKSTPKGLVFIHGPVAAIGIILLIVYSFYQTPKPIVSIILFIIAASGGFFMVYRDMTGNKVSKWIAVAHGLIALTGFAFLIAFTFFSP